MESQELVKKSAREFARWWIEKERGFVAGLASSDRSRRLAAIQGAAGYFKVARNFPTAFDVKQGLDRLGPALDVLSVHGRGPVDQGNLAHVVGKLRRALGDAYGGRDLLSAATKFLWTLKQDPVIIFDSQARMALGARTQDYDVYLTKWRDGYSPRQSEVAEACAEESALALLGTEREVAAREWFRRRVYDIYLWYAGAPRREQPGT